MMKRIFQRFSRLLNERIAGRVPTTEDSVRYTFFCATRLPPAAVILEEFHSKRKEERRRIDAILLTADGQRIAVEFKYHKSLRTGGPRPRPLQAGTILSDIGRLHRYRAADDKYLVYVTDQEMARYMRSPRNGLVDLFEVPNGKVRITPRLMAEKCPTFVKYAGKAFCADVTLAYRDCLQGDFELRIWKVR